MFKRADPIDLEEGMIAYDRYHLVMQKIADRFGFDLPKVIAVFVSLSPNSSYHQNLRSCVSVLHGVREGWPRHAITVSTYGHCRDRAYAYATGSSDFLSEVKGPKITSFYHNILRPRGQLWVTVDGHMSCIWQGRDMTMREALISARTYRDIRDATIRLAFKNFMVPCQMQAVLWFTRKRLSNVVYDPQLKLFADKTDVWNTFVDVNAIKPYRSLDDVDAEKVQQGRWKEAGMVDARAASQPALFPEQELASRRRDGAADRA